MDGLGGFRPPGLRYHCVPPLAHPRPLRGRLPAVGLQKLTGTDAFIVVDLDGAPVADGVVRWAKKVLVDGARTLARSRTYAWALLEEQISGASAGINAVPDERDAAVSAFVTEARPLVESGSLSLDAAKGVAPGDLADLVAADRRNTDLVGDDRPARSAAGRWGRRGERGRTRRPGRSFGRRRGRPRRPSGHHGRVRGRRRQDRRDRHRHVDRRRPRHRGGRARVRVEGGAGRSRARHAARATCRRAPRCGSRDRSGSRGRPSARHRGAARLPDHRRPPAGVPRLRPAPTTTSS